MLLLVIVSSLKSYCIIYLYSYGEQEIDGRSLNGMKHFELSIFLTMDTLTYTTDMDQYTLQCVYNIVYVDVLVSIDVHM